MVTQWRCLILSKLWVSTMRVFCASSTRRPNWGVSRRRQVLRWPGVKERISEAVILKSRGEAKGEVAVAPSETPFIRGLVRTFLRHLQLVVAGMWVSSLRFSKC